MSDYQLGDTIYHKFTTRAFATGVPTVLAGTPVVSIYEDDSITQITAGITLTIDFDSVVGLNHLTVVATGGNGFETGKFYQAVITTGTVGGVSVVGETVWTFSLDASAASLQVAALNDVAATDIVSAGAITTSSGAVSTVTTTTTATNLTTNNDKTGYSLTQAFPTNFSSQVISAGGATDSLVQGFLNNTIAETTADNIAANFETFYDNANALTAQTVDDVGGGAGGGGIAVTQQLLTRAKGATSQIIPFSVQDSSSAVGGKLTGLVFNTASLTASYNRIGAAGSATAITLVTATKGTWVSSGFVAIDGTNMAGDYELHIPDAALATGSDGVWIRISGAANMVPVEIYIDLVVEVDLGTDNRVLVSANAHTSGQTVTAVTGGATAAAQTTAQNDLDIITGADGVNLLSATQASIDAVETDTAAMQPQVAKIPLSDGSITWNATALASINAEADTALTDYDGPTNAEMEARTPTAAQLAYITANASTGLPVTFTTAGGSTTTAVIALVDGSAGSSTDDQYNGRLLVFTDGTLKGVVTDITDYVGSTTTATITAITFAPTASHNARLI